MIHPATIAAGPFLAPVALGPEEIAKRGSNALPPSFAPLVVRAAGVGRALRRGCASAPAPAPGLGRNLI